MKTASAISSPIPPRIAALRKDRRGFPIPATVARRPDGTPDFRVIDEVLWRKAIKDQTCGICGERLGVHKAFVGGPQSIKSGCFIDLPMHRDCAAFAIQTCPFLALPRFAYAAHAPTIKGMVVTTDPNMSENRPDIFGIGMTRDFHFDGTYLHVDQWESVEYWRHGKRVDTIDVPAVVDGL